MKRAAVVVGLAFLGFVVACFVVGAKHYDVAGLTRFDHWLYYQFGVSPTPNPHYQWWSGAGSDLGEATLVSAVVTATVAGLRHLNCHHTGCWRIRTHPVFNPDRTPTPYKACRRHHPDMDHTAIVDTERMATWHQRHPKPPPPPAPPAAKPPPRARTRGVKT